MSSPIPSAISGQKYISLTIFQKTGVGVSTPVWFGQDNDKLYVMTCCDMGKAKGIRNNLQGRVGPCTISGKVTVAEFRATARTLPSEDYKHARVTIICKSWTARLPLIRSRTDTYFEITFL